MQPKLDLHDERTSIHGNFTSATSTMAVLRLPPSAMRSRVERHSAVIAAGLKTAASSTPAEERA